MACDSVIADYFINFLVVVCIGKLLCLDNLELKESVKPWVSVNIEENFRQQWESDPDFRCKY